MAFNKNQIQIALKIDGKDIEEKLPEVRKQVKETGLEIRRMNKAGEDTTEIAKKYEELIYLDKELSKEVTKARAAFRSLGYDTADGAEVAIRSLKELRRENRILSRDFENAEIGSERQKELAELIRANKKLIADQTDSLKELKAEAAIKQEDNTLAAMSTQLKDLRQQFDNLETGADGADALAKDIATLELKLAESTRAAKEFKDAVKFNALTSVTKDLKEELEKVKEEMKGMDKASDEFKVASAKAKKLETAIEGVDNEIKQLKKEGSDLQPIESAFDKLRSGLESKLGPIGASIAGVFAVATIAEFATEAIAWIGDITAEFSELRRTTSQLTNASGADLDAYTAKVAAISKTFDQDNKEILQSANALSKQMGISFDDALDKISQGFLRGADLNGEFLDSLKEYPAQAKAAGLSADEFIQVLSQSTVDGVFSDKGIDTIKEFGLRIREQTKPTQEAIESIFGKEKAAELLSGIRDGSVSTIKALEIVSEKMNDTTIPANKLQTVLADVFGAAGEDAGLPFIQTLKDLRKNTEEYASANSELIQKQREKLATQRELAEAENELSKLLDPLISKTKLYATQALTAVLGVMNDITSSSSTWGERFTGVLTVINPPIGILAKNLFNVGKEGKLGFDLVTAAAIETNKQVRDLVGVTEFFGEAKKKTIPIGIAAPVKRTAAESELDAKRQEDAKKEAESRRKDWESAKEKADNAAKSYAQKITEAEANVRKLQGELLNDTFDKQIAGLNTKAENDLANLSGLREVTDARIKTLSGSKATIKAQTDAINAEVASEITKQTALIKQLADKQIAEVEAKRAEAKAKAAESIATDVRDTTTKQVEGKASSTDAELNTLQNQQAAKLRLVEVQAVEYQLQLERGFRQNLISEEQYTKASENLELLKEEKILSIIEEGSVEQSTALRSRYDAQVRLAEQATENTIAQLRKEKAARIAEINTQETTGVLNPNQAAEARLAAEKRYNSAIRQEEEKLKNERVNIYQEYTNAVDSIADKQIAQFKTVEEKKTEVQRTELEKRKENEAAMRDAAIQVATLVSDTAFQIAAQNAEAKTQKELEEVEKSKNASLSKIDKEKAAAIKAAGSNAAAKERAELAYATAKEKIDRESKEKEDAIKKEAHERDKKRSIAQAIINGAIAVTQILAQYPKFDFGVATAIGIGLAVASTAAQVAVISNQKFERGGIAQGASHAQGGIKMVDSQSGQIVGEMEGGEPYMILSKDTYVNNRGVINRLLHSSMHEGGKPIFQHGGIAGVATLRHIPSYAIGGVTAPNTTPTVNREAIIVKVEIPEMKELAALIPELRALAESIRTQPIQVYAPVVLTDVEAGLAELAQARTNARIA